MKKIIIFILIGCFSSIIKANYFQNSNINKGDFSNFRSYYGRVVRVFDGDSISVKLRYNQKIIKVRLLGIDTPELSKLRKGYVEYYAREAKYYLVDLVMRQNIKMVFKPHNKFDRYKRLLAFIYRGRLDVNRKLLIHGYAKVYRKIPSFRHYEFLRYERIAKTKYIGIWNIYRAKRFYKRRFFHTNNTHIVKWFWENDRTFLYRLLREEFYN